MGNENEGSSSASPPLVQVDPPVLPATAGPSGEVGRGGCPRIQPIRRAPQHPGFLERASEAGYHVGPGAKSEELPSL